MVKSGSDLIILHYRWDYTELPAHPGRTTLCSWDTLSETKGEGRASCHFSCGTGTVALTDKLSTFQKWGWSWFCSIQTSWLPVSQESCLRGKVYGTALKRMRWLNTMQKVLELLIQWERNKTCEGVSEFSVDKNVERSHGGVTLLSFHFVSGCIWELVLINLTCLELGPTLSSAQVRVSLCLDTSRLLGCLGWLALWHYSR